ncbi:MAG: hypothetical protein HFG80_08885 [Eubacterium sp.]|jgi:hypothetical protein|nr:hypothetical protein [Eubacterium sp.]
MPFMNYGSRHLIWIDFIKKLEAVSAGNEKDAVKMQQDTLKEQYDEIRADIDEIEAGEYCLRQEWNEEYDEWYNAGVDEEYYRDPERVAQLIDSACDYIHDCKDAGNSV